MRTWRMAVMWMVVAAGVGGAMAAGTVPAAAGRGAGSFVGPRVEPGVGDGRMAVQLLALRSPNPYVREMAYHEHDGDWVLDEKGEKFSVKVAGMEGRAVTGKLQVEKGILVARFDDEAGLARGWVVPADAKLTVEEARRLLMDMGERLAEPDPTNLTDPNRLKRLCAMLKGLELREDVTTGQVRGFVPGPGFIECRISVSDRIFRIRGQERISSMSGHEDDFTGYFGWDKERKWTAWPAEMIARTSGGADPGGLFSTTRTLVAVPVFNLALGRPVTASSSLEGHAASLAGDGKFDTFWQPASEDAHPMWTVDLKRAVSLTNVRLVFPNLRNDLINPVVEISEDGKTWRSVQFPRVMAGTSNAVGFPDKTTARYVRLTFSGATEVVGARGGRGASTSRVLEVSEVIVEGVIDSK